jgi:hypothetical protein
MLKFINENDFLLVDKYVQVSPTQVSWQYTHGDSLSTGIISEGFIRTNVVQNGTQQVMTGTTPAEYDEYGVEITPAQPIYSEEPLYVTVEIDVWKKLNDLANSNTIIIEPISILPIKENAKETINSIRDTAIASGVEYNGDIYQTDAESISDIMGAIIAGVSTQWLTQTNKVVNMTVADMQELGQAVAAHKAHYIYKAREHKDAIELLNTAESIELYLANMSWV